MNTKMLKSRMVLASETLAELSAVVGVTPGTLSNKINGKAEFTQREIAAIAQHYSLNAEQIKDIFFCD